MHARKHCHLQIIQARLGYLVPFRECTTDLDRRARAGVVRISVVLGDAQVLVTARAFRICRVCGYNTGLDRCRLMKGRMWQVS